MKQIRQYCVGASIACLSMLSISMAHADTSIPNGWYVEGHLGATSVQNRPYRGSVTRQRYPFSVALGYKFMPFLGAEFGYTKYQRMKISDPSLGDAALDQRFAYYVAAKAILPIVNSGAEVYAKLGMSRLSTNVTITNPANNINLGVVPGGNKVNRLYGAIGAQYYFVQSFGVGLEWARANGNNRTGDSDFYSIGFTFLVD